MVDYSLSDQQKSVVGLLEEGLTIRKIANLRGTSVQAVYKTINKLKKKGVLSGTQLRGFKKVRSTKISTTNNWKNAIRLHGLSFRIKILNSSDYYHRLRNIKNVDHVDNNTIRLNRESLIVYIEEEFTHPDIDKVNADCMDYLNHLLLKLENSYRIVLTRPRFTTIKQLSAHYSEINNELSKDYLERKEKLNIYARDDGKLWATIDNSFNLKEFEALHPNTAERDIRKVVNVFNDYRENDLPLPSETFRMINDTAKNLEDYGKHIKTHTQAMISLAESIKILNKKLSEEQK